MAIHSSGCTSTEAVASELSFRKRVVFSVVVFIIVFCICAGIAECFFRLHRGLLPRQAQLPDGVLDYGDTWREGGMGPGGFLKENFSAQVTDGLGGTVTWTNNSQGFRSNLEFSASPQPGVLRILSLGDSFTAGYRVGQGKTYSDHIAGWISSEIGPCEVLISCVENPGRGLQYLQQQGHTWKPHIVLLGITLGNDILEDYAWLDPEEVGFSHGLQEYNLPDYCFRERSIPQKCIDKMVLLLRRNCHIYKHLTFASRPILAWYGRTPQAKLFDVYHGLGVFIADPPKMMVEAFRRHFQIIEDYKQLCQSTGIELVILIIPQRFQVQPRDWQAAVKHYTLQENRFDLDGPNRRIRQFCRQEEIPVIDPSVAMRRAHESQRLEMYLPGGDMHWNKEGHLQFARVVNQGLEPIVRASRQRLLEDSVM